MLLDRQCLSTTAVHSGISEFGEIMGRSLRQIPKGVGVVLSDSSGDPIDFAYRPQAISTLDLQLCGAQFTQCVGQLSRAWTRLGMEPQLMVIEALGGTLITVHFGQEYPLTLLLQPHAPLGQAMKSFQIMSQALHPLLMGDAIPSAPYPPSA